MVKKVYYDNKSEMTISFTKENTFVFEITDIEDPNSIIFQNVKLSTEDVKDLINDLQYYLDSISPSGFNFHNKEHYEAYLQGQSKLELSNQIQRDIEERFGDKYYITKEGKPIKKEKYDIVPSEIELQELKLKKQNGKKGI